MAERAGIFDSGADFDVSDFVPQKPKPAAPREKVRQVSEGSEFKSREPEERPAAAREAAPTPYGPEYPPGRSGHARDL